MKPLNKLLSAAVHLSLTGLLLFGSPKVVEAKLDDAGRPWAQHTITVGPTIGFGWGSYSTTLVLGVGAGYYVLDGLEVSLFVTDSITFWNSRLENEFPGSSKQLPSNEVTILPSLRYVFYRSRSFSPYVMAGVGPSFLNHDSPVLGYWQGAFGAFVGAGKYVSLDLSLQLFGYFPQNLCQEAYTSDTVILEGPCYPVGLGPGLGIVMSF